MAVGRSSTGSFTSAHADGCAEQCFEGVQFGSLFKVPKVLTNRLPVCFPATIVFALSKRGGPGVSAARLALTRFVPVCLMKFSRCNTGLWISQERPFCVKGSFLADAQKAHSGGAERGIRHRLWARGYAAWISSKSRILVISLISSILRFSSSTHKCGTPFSS